MVFSAESMLPVSLIVWSRYSPYNLKRGVDAPLMFFSAESMLSVSFILRSRCSPYHLKRGVDAPCIIYRAEPMLPISFIALSQCSPYRLQRGVGVDADCHCFMTGRIFYRVAMQYSIWEADFFAFYNLNPLNWKQIHLVSNFIEASRNFILDFLTKKDGKNL